MVPLPERLSGRQWSALAEQVSKFPPKKITHCATPVFSGPLSPVFPRSGPATRRLAPPPAGSPARRRRTPPPSAPACGARGRPPAAIARSLAVVPLPPARLVALAPASIGYHLRSRPQGRATPAASGGRYAILDRARSGGCPTSLAGTEGCSAGAEPKDVRAENFLPSAGV